MSTKIYGCSDDLIEFEGDVSGEVSTSSALIMCSDGTLLDIEYGHEGVWRIRVLRQGDLFTHLYICKEQGDEIYSDSVTFNSGLKWAYAAKGGWERVS